MENETTPAKPKSHDHRFVSLILDARSKIDGRPPAVGSPFVPVYGSANPSADVRSKPGPLIKVVATLCSKLLKDCEPQQVGRVMMGKFVGAAKVPRTSTAIAHTYGRTEARTKNTGHVVVGWAYVCGPSDVFGYERNTILKEM